MQIMWEHIVLIFPFASNPVFMPFFVGKNEENTIKTQKIILKVFIFKVGTILFVDGATLLM